MPTSVFIDSNIWLYSLMIEPSASESELRKRSLATQLISADDILISTQVINETCSVLSRKAAFEESQLRQIIQELYDGCIVIEINLDRNKFRYSFARL